MHSATKVAKYLIDTLNNQQGCRDVTLLKVIKLTYIAHGWMLALCDRPLISEDVEAWQYGPVIPELYRDLKQFGRDHITTLNDAYHVELDEQESSIVEQVCEIYGKYTASQLVGMTHAKGTPWSDIWRAGKGFRVIISNESIKAYYKRLAEGSNA